MKTEAVVFIDTNCFLQLRDLKDLNWRSLFPEAELVRIMIAPVVIAELDKHKNGSSDRRRNRSRAALKLIDEASQAPQETIVLREKPMKVQISLAHFNGSPTSHDLNPYSPDDSLVAAVLACETEACLLSHDTGPRISARRAKLRAYAPPEDWLLAHEVSEERKRLARLEAEIAALTNRAAKLSVQWAATQNEPSALHCFRLPPLSSRQVDALSKRYLAGNPAEKPTFYVGIHAGYQGTNLTHFDVEAYRQSYDKFTEEVRQFFSSLHDRVLSSTRLHSVPFKILNEGAASAKDLVVTLNVRGDGHLLADKREVDSPAAKLVLPAAPKLQNRTFQARHFEHALAPLVQKGSDRADPTKFYWTKRPRGVDSTGAYKCADFRPGRVFEDEVIVWATDARGEVHLEVTVSASDTTTNSAAIPFRIEEAFVEWNHPALLLVLPDTVRSLLHTIT